MSHSILKRLKIQIWLPWRYWVHKRIASEGVSISYKTAFCNSLSFCNPAHVIEPACRLTFSITHSTNCFLFLFAFVVAKPPSNHIQERHSVAHFRQWRTNILNVIPWTMTFTQPCWLQCWAVEHQKSESTSKSTSDGLDSHDLQIWRWLSRVQLSGMPGILPY